jgi:hypothetical protein
LAYASAKAQSRWMSWKVDEGADYGARRQAHFRQWLAKRRLHYVMSCQSIMPWLNRITFTTALTVYK